MLQSAGDVVIRFAMPDDFDPDVRADAYGRSPRKPSASPAGRSMNTSQREPPTSR